MTEFDRLVAQLSTMPLHQASEYLCGRHGATFAELTERSRHLLRRRDDSRKRQAIWWTLRRIKTGMQPRWSYPDIAEVWGTNHSTIITAVQREERLRQTSQQRSI